MKLFFSYGHDKNSVIVERIRDDVMAEKHDVWIDIDRLKSGNDWRRKIAESIEESEVFFSFASEHSLQESGVCRDELSIAVAVKGALIQSVILEKGLTMPANASFRQYIDMSDWQELYSTDAFEPWYAEKLQEILKVINDPETKKYEEEVRYLKDILRPNLSIAYKNSMAEAMYCGRGWLKAMTDRWLKDPDSRRILLMTGSPGSGKSAFVSHEFIYNIYAGAVIYCQWDNCESNNADAVIRSIIFQLSSHYPDYRERVLKNVKRLEEDGTELKDCDASELYRSLFVRPMRETINGDRNTILILIDGIDEIERHSRSGARYEWKNELAELIERSAGELPEWIRFFITSRKDTKVTRFLKNFDTIDLDAYGTENRNDVDDYIALRLAGKMSADVIQKVQDKCEDNFQHAVLLTEGLLKGQIPPEDVEEMPASLAGLYYAYFSRTFPDRAVYHDRYMPVFSAVCVSEEPIPAKTVWRACDWDAFEKQEFRLNTSSYFPRDDIFKVFHLSLIDWLCSEDAYEFGISRKSGIRLIAKGCRTAWLDDPEDMNRYELLYFMKYLKKTRDPLLKEVLQDTGYGEMLKEYALSAMAEYRFADALSLAQDAAEIFAEGLPKTQDPYLEAMLAQVNALVRLSQKEAAEKLCREAVQKGGKPGMASKVLAALYARYGKIASMCNHWDESDAAFREAEHITGQQNDPYETAQIMNQHALMFRIASRFKEAQQVYEQLDAMIPPETMKQEDPGLYVNITAGKAFCSQSRARSKEAGQYLDQCRAVLEQDPHLLNDEDTSQVYYLLSFHAYAEGQYAEGLEYVEHSIALRERVYGSDSVEICSHLNELGHILLKLGRFREAEKAFRKSLRLRTSFYGEDNVYTAYSKRNLAKLLTERKEGNDLAEAYSLLSDALILFTRYNGTVSDNAAMVQRDMAECAILQEQYTAAAECLDQAETIYRQLGTLRGLGHCRKSRGNLARAEGKPAEAVSFYREAISLYEESGLNSSHTYITSLQDTIRALEQQ